MSPTPCAQVRLPGAAWDSTAAGPLWEELGSELQLHDFVVRDFSRPGFTATFLSHPSIGGAAALHVWKTVVTNTPKTLGELLPQLMAIIIESLADPGGGVHCSLVKSQIHNSVRHVCSPMKPTIRLGIFVHR